MDDQNFWTDKTPLETGLILILFVATPFLVILLLIYILLPILCVHCSIKCSQLCDPTPNPPPPIPPPPPPDNGRSIMLEYIEDACPYNEQVEKLEDVNHNIENAFIASIMEDVYEDDTSRQRYLCAAAIITYKWVITGSICFETKRMHLNFEESILVRAGSNYWSKGGSIHEVKQILFANSKSTLASVAAVNLKKGFPKLLSISPISLSTTSSFRENLGLFEMYHWKSNDSLLLPLILRKKYVTLTKHILNVLPDSQCKLYSKKEEFFCVSPKKEEKCLYYAQMSFPITEGNILIGISFGKICNAVNNKTIYLIFDTSLVLSWLKNITH